MLRIVSDLGPKLRRMRVAAGFDRIEAIASACETSERTISNYERGERLPGIDFLVAFARATGTDLHHLLRLRIEAAGEDPGVLQVRETSPSYGDGLNREMHAELPGIIGQDNASQLRAELRDSEISMEWALLLMQLVTSGDLRAAGARAIIDFIKKEGNHVETKND